MVKLKKFLFFAALFLRSPVSILAEGGSEQEGSSMLVPIENMFAQEIDTARKIIDMVMEFMVKYSFQVFGGFVVIFLGWLLARFVANAVTGLLEKKKIDPPVIKFIATVVKGLVLVFAVIAALGKFGITIAPFIAGLSVIGFGASFAVQGPLSNYAAGTTLVFTKPFKVGDIIEVVGVQGQVTDMTLARTEMKTLDGTVIFIPNKQIIGEVMHNYSKFKRLDFKIGISYGSNVDKAIEIIKKIVSEESRISDTPPPKVGISDFADSSIDIYARLWCEQVNYYDVLFDLNGKVFKEFSFNNIQIPFPQRDVHIIKDGN